MENFNIEYLNRFNVRVNGIYKFTIDEWGDLKKNADYKELCCKYSEMKIRFADQADTLQKSPISIIFSKALPYEIEIGKDMALWNLKEFRVFMQKLIDCKLFTSTIMYFMILNIMCKYTEWAYLQSYRADYYITRDLTSIYNIDEAVQNDNDVYTIKEMEAIISNVERIDVKIALQAMLEGLKSSEIIYLYKSEFDTVENHSLILSSGRVFKMSDKLYDLCHKYSKMEYATFHYRDARENQVLLNNGKYLLRTTRKSTSNNPITSSQLATIIRNDLNAINVNVEARLFRTYAMVCDMCYGMSIEDINKKYNTKYNHPRNLYRNVEIKDKMQEKVKLEQEQA